MSEEIQVLLRLARESLRAARGLRDMELHRFSVGRSYFTMFYVATALLLAQGRRYHKHSNISAGFGEHLVKPGLVPAEFHQFLIRAERLRSLGDYDGTAEFGESDSVEQIECAKRFVDLGVQLLMPHLGTSEGRV